MIKITRNKIYGAIIVSALIVAVFALKESGMLSSIDPQKVKDMIDSYGSLAPVIYIIMFALVPLTLFPDAVLAIAGGMAFGVYMGSVYTIIGAVIGGTISFYISRLLGREIVEKLVHGKGKWFEAGVEKRGFLLILALRLIPLVPFDVISYGAGLSKIRYRDFAIATLIGIIPGVFVYSNLGDKTLNVKSPEFIAAIGFLAALMVLSWLLKKKISFEKLQDELK